MHRIRPLVLGLLPVFALAGVAAPIAVAHAATRHVTNCNDSGPGSLRAAAASADSGDLIDLRRLSCSRIVLTSGAVQLPDQFITIVGAGASRITVDGNSASRVFEHTSSTWPLNNDATLRLIKLSVANGLDLQDSGRGGCILAGKNVRLEYAQVHHCVARGTAPGGFAIAQGGGIFAVGRVSLFHAAVFDNRAEGGTDSEGGGVLAGELLHVDHSVLYGNYSDGNDGAGRGGGPGGLFVTYSTIRNNVAVGNAGGIDVANGPVVINKSTISGNSADHYGAAGSFSSGYPVTISDSTISGNRTLRTPAALGLDGHSSNVRVVNSTIVDNIADAPFSEFADGAVTQSGTVEYQSTIIANNFVGGAPLDLWAQIAFGARVIGSNNLIEASNAPLPADTIGSDPMLGPLADNGGLTRTHALLPGSPASDAGNNGGRFLWDQRGPGFPRVVGPRADIGAFESGE
ncbi:MAG TPA: choice-of-anchor Q domain-containing protein [Luteimonas sp.]|nr:choice-of-anchor Q domain-containing protein [Luteimonas sp.]